MTQEEIKEIANEVVNNTIFCTKEVLTSDEAAAYMGIAKSYLYKLTSKRLIPHYKPIGKMCYFNRKELESWLQRNRVAVALLDDLKNE
jgi:excisionase family DNA binding protein